MFINDNSLNYKGEVPAISCFDTSVSINDYSKYTQRFASKSWATQEETISYLEKDLSRLLEVINKFNIIKA